MTNSISHTVGAIKRSETAVLADPCLKDCTLSSEISMRPKLGTTLHKSRILIDHHHC